MFPLGPTTVEDWAVNCTYDKDFGNYRRWDTRNLEMAEQILGLKYPVNYHFEAHPISGTSCYDPVLMEEGGRWGRLGRPIYRNVPSDGHSIWIDHRRNPKWASASIWHELRHAWQTENWHNGDAHALSEAYGRDMVMRNIDMRAITSVDPVIYAGNKWEFDAYNAMNNHFVLPLTKAI